VLLLLLLLLLLGAACEAGGRGECSLRQRQCGREVSWRMATWRVCVRQMVLRSCGASLGRLISGAHWAGSWLYGISAVVFWWSAQ
jgi:hypothetical protein